MKKRKFWICLTLIVFCIAAIISLSSCSADRDINNNTELGEQFMDCLINNEREEAYDLIKNTVTLADFMSYWSSIRPIAEGAKSYEMEQIGWNISRSNGQTAYVSAYQAHLDNGKDVLLRVTTFDNISGIAGLYLSDITDFISRTDAFVPAVRIVLIVVSVLAIAFAVWMLVDCIRRNIKYKALWIILLFIGVSFAITIGDTSGFNFMIGLIFQTSSIVADPGIMAVQIKLIVPAGAILYLIMRKRFTIVQTPASEAVESTEAPTNNNEAEIENSPSSNEDK